MSGVPADRQCGTRGHCSVSLALTSDWTLKRRVLTPVKALGSYMNPGPTHLCTEPRKQEQAFAALYLSR